MARTLPDLFEESRIASLAGFFEHLGNCLRLRSGSQQPRIVLLSSESLGDTNYEQAFLARYLDIDLVSAADLTVRNRQVFTKTFSGLQQVDVIFRWVDDLWCDPLFLRPDSLAGVPGLVDAIKAGSVVVSNALGCGLIDAPAMLPLVATCGEFLGINAGNIPTIGLQWGASGSDLTRNSVLLEAWRELKQRPTMLSQLSDQEFQQWQDKVSQRPYDYVQVEAISPSLAPAWEDGHLDQHGIVLRLFAVSDGAGGFKILPGGLVRSGPKQRSLYRGMRQEGTSKDVWVPTPDHMRLRKRAQLPQSSIFRGGPNLLSSRIDALFWCGRELERLDHLCRLVNTSISAEQELIRGDRNQRSPAVMALCAHYIPLVPTPTVNTMYRL